MEKEPSNAGIFGSSSLSLPLSAGYPGLCVDSILSLFLLDPFVYG
jgi:hypothetical protein